LKEDPNMTRTQLNEAAWIDPAPAGRDANHYANPPFRYCPPRGCADPVACGQAMSCARCDASDRNDADRKGTFHELPICVKKPMHVLAPKLLPAWFVTRMIDSIGDFAFLLTTGDVVHFVTINAIRQDVSGELWVDVALATKAPDQSGARHGWIWRRAAAGGGDISASIQAAHIFAAVDLTIVDD
jgi:hypothetical protein